MFKNLDNSDKFLISYSYLFWGSLLLGHSVQSKKWKDVKNKVLKFSQRRKQKQTQ